MPRTMKDSGIKWAPIIADSFTTKRLKYILFDRNEKNNPVITNNILSLTAKQGVVPLEEKEGGGNKPKEDLSLYRVARPGDIVMNCMNVISGSVAMSNYYGCLSPVYYTFRTINPEDEERFFNYIFQTTQFQRSLVGFANGILIKESSNGKLNTIRLRVSVDMLGSLFVPYTSPKNQKLIADYLDHKSAEIDALSADIQSEIDTLEAYKRSVITEAVTKGLDKNAEMKDSGIHWVGEIPAHWDVEKGKYCLRYVQKPTKPDDDVITCFRDGEVTLRKNRREEGFTISLKEIGYQGIDVGDLIVHGMDGFAGSIGISDSRGKASPVLNVLDTNHNKRYIMYYLRNMAYNGVFLALATGIRVRTCDTNWGKLRELPYILPPKHEQDAIAKHIDTVLSAVDDLIKDKQNQLETLAEYKKSVIYEYVTGKKEVPDGEF